LVLFYATNIGAVLFFLHKVCWLVQYRRLQGAIVSKAVKDLRAGNAGEIAEWERLARQRWVDSLGGADIRSAETFIHRVEEGLTQVRHDLRSSRRSVAEILRDALALGKARAGSLRPADRANRPAHGSAAGSSEVVLAIRRLTRRATDGTERYRVQLDLCFDAVPVPRPPDRKLYELTTKSRYGLLRRAFVFFSGVADVVYSSQHVALMSQNVHVPIALLARRLSLVLLVVVVVVLDVILGLRTELALMIDGLLGADRGANHEAGFWATAVGSLVWVAAYGSIYFTLYLVLRRNYQVNRKKLRTMLSTEVERLARIYREHLDDLSRWGAEYGKSLDDAIDITVHHAETLIDHYGDKLRRRVAGPTLLEAAKLIADRLFSKLPEAQGDLQDAATTHRHSLAHYVWPRPDEMEYQVRLAQYRAAWQDLELTIAELRREQPDPALAHALWRSATVYASVFGRLLPAGTADGLRQAYAQMVTDCVTLTDQDLGELDRRFGELIRALHEQLDAATALIQSRVELASSSMQASVAALSAEIIQVREQARLEAMAFEI
jgi:hypothetical protein